MADPPSSAVKTRAGHVALVGLPNVGKSSLLNALTGEKLSIVTAKAQTTRERVTGILTTAEAQLIFVDTPGLLEPRYLLQESMLAAARGALLEADVVLLLLDATRPADVPEGDALELLHRSGSLLVAVNKVDASAADAQERLAAWSAERLGKDALRISATEGTGIDELRSRMIAALPPSPFFYPPDELAVQPVRFFVAELVRETVFEQLEQEVPYSTAVVIDEFREAETPIYIRATVVVERESQKGIVIGRGGERIRRLGERSREKVEAFLGAHIYLDLWVKARPGWRKKKGELRELGYVPPEGA